MTIKIRSVEDLFTSSKFPTDVLQRHNAFPDAIFFDGKEYVAFRSAKNHYPTRSSTIVIISRKNNSAWMVELTIQIPRTDVRDPRFLVVNGHLNLYFGTVHANRYAFRLLSTYVVLTTGDEQWTKPIRVYKPGYIHSRVRKIGHIYYMCVYSQRMRPPFHSVCRIVTSTDGLLWNEKSLFGELVEEGTESDCIVIGKNKLLWIIRNDFGLNHKAGSYIKIIQRNGTVLSCRYDKRKYDAPLLLSIQEDIYLLSRSQESFHGNYNTGIPLLPKAILNSLYLVLYWLTPKTTSLWKIDIESLEIIKCLDLPSQGDTGYCSFVENKNGEKYIYNYSSDLSKHPTSWRRGQTKPTSIYKYLLEVA